MNISPMLEPTLAPDLWNPPPTLTYQNLLFSRFPINSILGIIIGPYKKVGFGRCSLHCAFSFCLETRLLLRSGFGFAGSVCNALVESDCSQGSVPQKLFDGKEIHETQP